MPHDDDPTAREVKFWIKLLMLVQIAWTIVPILLLVVLLT